MGNSLSTNLAQEIATLVVANLKESGFVVAPTYQESAESREEWGSRQEAADIIKCSLPTVHGMMKQGYIIFRKCGRKTIVNLTDLQRKLQDGTLAKYHRRA